MKIGLRGEPHLRIGSLSIWIDNLEFPNAAAGQEDANWLNIAAEYRGLHSTSKASGSLLMNMDIARFMEECRQLDAALSGEACLNSYEPNLDVRLRMEKQGRIEAETRITHDHLSEEHVYRSELDQSYLKGIIGQCEAILERFPLRGLP